MTLRLTKARRMARMAMVVAVPAVASACSSSSIDASFSAKTFAIPLRVSSFSHREKDCMMRAMFFESHRSSREGMVAVGTVVMNRLRSGNHGDTVCEVVGQKGQFAKGVMTRQMKSSALPDVEAAAEAVLAGERHPKVKNAMFFHTAGLKFPYKNMHYVVVAGGNAFYEKRNRRGDPVVLPPERKRTFLSKRGSFGESAVAAVPVALAGPTPSQSRASDVAFAAAEPSVETLPASTAALPASTAALPSSAPFAMAETQPTGVYLEVAPNDATAIGAMIAGQQP
jgi:spore germination cell wall hydrolase CwlJ-like protein